VKAAQAGEGLVLEDLQLRLGAGPPLTALRRAAFWPVGLLMDQEFAGNASHQFGRAGRRGFRLQADSELGGLATSLAFVPIQVAVLVRFPAYLEMRGSSYDFSTS
jgi:hypothetical protein